jgi:hypothetical protein
MLDRGGPAAGLIRANSHVAQAVALERQFAESYPEWASIDQWALFRSLDPEEAARIAQRIRANPAIDLGNRLQHEINPFNASSVIKQYWMQKLLGNNQRALEIYRDALKEGIPLPPL